MTATGADLQLRTSEFYTSGGIETKLGVKVERIDVDAQIVHGDDESAIHYDYLVLATGGKPREMKAVPGHNLKNIYHLRSPEDANNIVKSAEGKHVVVVGSSYIGTEVAAYLASRAASVTVICRSDVPLQKTLGPKVGAYLKSLHESKGVRFVINAQVSAFTSASGTEEVDDNVAFVHLTTEDGPSSPLQADVVILGIGVDPATDYLQGSKVELDDQGYVITNSFLQSSVSNIFAAGDIAKFPLGKFLYV